MVQTISFAIILLATCGEYSLWMIHRWVKVGTNDEMENSSHSKFRYKETPKIQNFEFEKKHIPPLHS